MDIRCRDDGSGSDKKMRNKFSLEPPMRPLSGELRYLTTLWVSLNADDEQPHVVSASLNSSRSTITRFEPGADKIVAHYQKIEDKIKSALKVLAFREQRVLVQFWLPYPAGKHQLLTTRDQPFGLGVIDDEGLCSYRKHSEQNHFLVDKDHQEYDVSPPARVFRRGMPEWTCDVINYNAKDFPLRDCAIRCNLHGYLALPVFDSTTWLCVGVLELLMSSKYTSYAYEVQQVHRVLKNLDLRPTQAFDFPTFNVHNEHRQNELGKISSVLKDVCRIQRLPLAQTWVVSPMNSFVSHEQILMKSCNSFDTRCLGKVCMSTAALPFHIQDLGMWSFRKACSKRHMDNSQGVVGRALSSRGASFCGDVTKLSEEDYPLVHNARMTKLMSCFAIFLHSVEGNNNYVLEFFLPLDMDYASCIPNLIQTLKEEASGFELGDTSSVQVVGPTREVISLSLSIDPHAIPIFSTATTTRISETVSSDAESMVANVTNTDSANVLNRWSSQKNYPNNFGGIIANSKNLAGVEVIKDNVDVVNPNVSMGKTSDTMTDAGEKSNRLKQGRKRKIDTLTMEAVEQHYGKPIDQAAKYLKVSRSTLKRFCREHKMPSWPLPKYNKKADHVTNLAMQQTSQSKQNLRRSTNECCSIYVTVFLLVRVKRWSCSIKRHGFSGKWWGCGKHRPLPCKSDFIYQAACLMVHLKRWRNKISIRHAMQNINHLAVCESASKPEHTTNTVNPYLHADWPLADSNLVHASPKLNNVSDTSMVTVKATFKEDMVKFGILASSGLLELENEVARRFKLKSKTFRLKYEDEDNDQILVACDADLHTLIGFSSSKGTIKLIILAND